MDESVTGSANFFGPVRIDTASSSEDLEAVAGVVERVHGLRISVAELEHDLFADPDARFFVARSGEQVVGSGVAKRSTQQGTLYAIARVLPEHRRRGAGSALYEALSAHARSLGVSALWGRVQGPESLQFALNRRFREIGREIESVLRVAGAPPPVPPPPGVDITSLGDRPELAKACHLVDTEAVPDIPSEMPFVALPFERWRAGNLEGPAALPHACTVALVDSEVVGYAALLARLAEPGTAEHQLTVVRRAWRGRGIASALKSAQIAWAARNGFERLVTYNHEANSPMRGVNARLGYEPQRPVVLVQGPLAPQSG
jgi:GNAT superfamily N-acetyltransferase